MNRIPNNTFVRQIFKQVAPNLKTYLLLFSFKLINFNVFSFEISFI